MEKDSELFVFTVYIFREVKVQSLFLSFLNDDEVAFSVEKDSEFFSFCMLCLSQRNNISSVLEFQIFSIVKTFSFIFLRSHDVATIVSIFGSGLTIIQGRYTW